MQITQVLTFLAVVIAGVVATPAGGPKPPKPSNAPQISCKAGFSTHCCTPNSKSEGTTCEGPLEPSKCKGVVFCCDDKKKAPDLRGVLDGLGRNAHRLIQDSGWQIETLEERLTKVAEALGSQALVCFIDALDECSEDQVANTISFFEDIGEHAADATLACISAFQAAITQQLSFGEGSK
ncbi:hypothetical protein V8E54_002271 [Elaphomyces granulatus]